MTASKGASSLIIHRIRTSVSLQEIKNVPKIYDLLRENSCFMTEHRWTEDVWDTTQLGFLLGLDPQFYDIPSATEKVRKELKAKQPPCTKVPKFQLAFTTPQVCFRETNVKTKAYAIETTKTDSMEMMKLLQ